MIHNDKVLGRPLIQYLDTRANIEAIATPEQGMLAYDTTNNKLLQYNGSAWTEISGSGGGTDLGWFNVIDYGADPTGVSDSTSSIQDAIDAADASNGGTIYFPSGEYKISGALQDAGGANSQLVLPQRTISQPEITIRFLGATRPSIMWNTVDTMPPQSAGCSVLKGTLTGQTGTAALIGAYNHGTTGTGSPSGSDYITVIFENLMVEMPTNPSYTAIDGSHVCAAYNGVQVHCGEWNTSTMTEPTHSNAYGIKMTTNNLQGYTAAEGVGVFGFYYGMRLTEFLNGDGLRVVGCKYPYEIPFIYHPITIQSMGTFQCPYGIISDGSGEARITVQNYDIEKANHSYSPAWMWSVSDIDDSGNNLYGQINWISIQGGVGNNHTLIKNGGENLVCIEIDSSPDVHGPNSSSNNNIALFNGATGKIIKDSGYSLSVLIISHEVVMEDGITPPSPVLTEDETDWVYGG